MASVKKPTSTRKKRNQSLAPRDLVMELMAIPGKSGQERQVADYIVSALRKAGARSDWISFDQAHTRTPISGDVGNLVLKLPGTLRKPRRMLTAHMDTVPICVGCRPTIKGNRVSSSVPDTGLGADNRAGCATILHAATEVLRGNLPHPPLTFVWFIQEEIGLQGSRLATRNLWSRPKLAFNWDGGSPTKLTIGATGGYRSDIEIRGIASHAGGAPEEGVSAIAIASLAIASLQERGWHGDIRQNGKHGTSNVGYIHGGEATNVVTDLVTLRAEARSHDPRFRKRILTEMEKAFREAARQVKNVAGQQGTVTMKSRLDYESFLLSQDEPSVVEAGAAVESLGHRPEFAIANGGVDANWITAHGVPTVSLGCGQKNQHMASEWLDLKEFDVACQIGLQLATAGAKV